MYISNVETILSALERFINQKPGLDPSNYYSLHDSIQRQRQGIAAYRQELRAIGKDRKRAHKALAEARGLSPARPELLIESFKRAFSGRLEWHEAEFIPGYDETSKSDIQVKTKSERLEYTTGQYWPTEYRKAAAAVLEQYVSSWRQAEQAARPQSGGQMRRIGQTIKCDTIGDLLNELVKIAQDPNSKAVLDASIDGPSGETFIGFNIIRRTLTDKSEVLDFELLDTYS
jgi:hypothetical protein